MTISNLIQDRFAPQLWNLLTQAARAATQRGWHLYLVGGAVRDLLLAEATTGNLSIKDIDLVVDGLHSATDVGAGVQLAQALQEIYPTARLEIYGAFQTAALCWDRDSEFDALGVDIATARTEFYPYPAANPEVSASSIRADLYRRDFTINALALRLTPADVDEEEAISLLDFFGGLEDLQTRQIRVLHSNSFVEDPTRIYRGVRFAVRLGFQLESQTEDYIRTAINSGIFDRTAREHAKTPALQTRLRTELKYLFQADYWQSALELLGNLGALQCIHTTLELAPELLSQLRLLKRCLTRFAAEDHSEHWQLQLAATIAYLAPEYRDRVAQNLQLSTDSITRLQNLAIAESTCKSLLSNYQRPSQVYQLLQRYDRSMLILIALRCRDSIVIRRKIWKYLTTWSQIKPILTGDDLRKLGYQPGPQYRQILDKLLQATLDGEIIDRSTAEAFLAAISPK
jgi:tRNA nucleotidyltransferase (CCA-adding enzyme)